ncbi:hypothetical protein CEXT_601571 [Caerostris extrusa]|uniref:Uncharacterized protein n=1 Tax=Caerostris extrusa TaxID=172846 RepID=A0AAV4SWE0_CAEEX|nr:hypothetical protein CEXT_601571 [Caerostris extrusa]
MAAVFHSFVFDIPYSQAISTIVNLMERHACKAQVNAAKGKIGKSLLNNLIPMGFPDKFLLPILELTADKTTSKNISTELA